MVSDVNWLSQSSATASGSNVVNSLSYTIVHEFTVLSKAGMTLSNC